MPTPQPLDPKKYAQLIKLLKDRRKNKRNAVQFSELPDRRGGTVPVASGELLIRTKDFERSDTKLSLARRLPYAAYELRLHGALTRIKLRATPPDTLGRILDDLHKDGLEVTANAVLPAGSETVVWKAHCTPEPTDPPSASWQADGQGQPVTVAVIDTGIHAHDRTDKWLDGLEWPWNIDPLDVFPQPDYLDWAAGHGTMCAGIIRQLAPSADVRVYRTLDSDGLGSSVDVAEAMVQAVTQDGARVVNLSLGVEADGGPPLSFTIALEQIAAYQARNATEVVIVAAAGNSGSTREIYPAACPGVTAVAAQTAAEAPAQWSSHGSWVACSAVGENVRSTYVKGTEDPQIDTQAPSNFTQKDSWALWTGTSFAAPQVAGDIARRAQHDGIGVRAALAQLLAGKPTTPDYGKQLGKILA